MPTMTKEQETISVKDEDIIEKEGFQGAVQRFEIHFQTTENDPVDSSIMTRLLTEDDERVEQLQLEGEGHYQIKDNTLSFTPNQDFIGTGQGVTFHAVTKNGNNISVRFIPTVVERVEEVMLEREPDLTYLTVEYQNLEGQKLIEDDQIKLQQGDFYAILPSQIPNYEVLDEDIMSGVITQYDLTQTFFYQPLRQGQIILQYLDELGRDIVPKTILKSDIGNRYRSIAKEFDEYDLISTEGPTEGKFAEERALVTFHYKKATHATLIIKFLDTKGHPLLEELTYRLKIGDQYKSHPRKITGYKVIEKPENADGVIKPGVTTIIFTYHARTNAKVVVRYVDEEDNLVMPSSTLTGAVGDPYKVEQKLIPTYDFLYFDGPTEGEFTDEIITVRCVYRRMSYN